MYSPEYEDTLGATPRRRPIRNIRRVVRGESKRRTAITDERTPYQLAMQAEDRATVERSHAYLEGIAAGRH